MFSRLSYALIVIVAISYGDVARADTALLPTSTVFVRVRGNDAAEFVLKQFKMTAEKNESTCDLNDRGKPPSLLCRPKDSYKAIVIAETDETGDLVTVNLYLRDDSLQVEEDLQAKMRIVLQEWAKDLKGKRHVKAIRQCKVPHFRLTLTKNVCESENLWQQ
jgi:hypothetical protein